MRRLHHMSNLEDLPEAQGESSTESLKMETVRAVVEAYGSGKIRLEQVRHLGKVRYAPSFALFDYQLPGLVHIRAGLKGSVPPFKSRGHQIAVRRPLLRFLKLTGRQANVGGPSLVRSDRRMEGAPTF